ncbi:MAG: SUMF1/EgtB/PvdO family nonheme iron enzyme [Polyangiaceae bacterium]|nr:SUMF1/EgtB/PvdO family nonheme iron enzyme [Polyangiaceae bacterium]
MNERTKSFLEAVLAGAALGAVGLIARYAPGLSGAPAPSAPSAHDAGSDGAPDTPIVAAPSVSGELSAPAGGASSSLPIGRAARFDADPVSKAACPPDMALVEGMFCPALPYTCLRTTASVGYRCAEYARGVRCLEEPDYRRYCIDRHEWPNRPGENPLVYVDWNEAKALCASAKKRLCRRSEWILACEGPKRLPYPWGFVRQPSPCNIDRATIPFDVEAMMDEATREGELSRLWQADRIGSHPDCVSSFGAYDLAGNVDEWTDDLLDNPASKHPSTLNGGYWGPVRNTCRLTTKGHGPTFRFYQVGFRCCADTVDGVPVPPPRPFVERDDRDDRDDERAAEPKPSGPGASEADAQ